MKKELEEQLGIILADEPVCQYDVLKSDEIVFTERVLAICEQECERYGKSWSCPPATGTLQTCRERCMKYQYALLFTTLAEVSDINQMEETLSTRKEHEQVVKNICKKFRQMEVPCYALSSESCAECESCAYPHSECRHRDYMLPCIESHGILVTDAAQKCGIDFFYDNQTVTWYGIIFFNMPA